VFGRNVASLGAFFLDLLSKFSRNDCVGYFELDARESNDVLMCLDAMSQALVRSFLIY
jgi:hypothetical protein